LATADVTLAEYPKIAVEVPRDIAAKHRDDTFALALYDPEQKDKAYRLDVAERDLSSPSPGSIPSPAATPVPTPQATPPLFGMPNGAIAFTPPPVGAGLGASSLPPEYIAFKGTAQALTLKANRPIIFAFYAAPPEPSPSPSPSPSAGAPSPSGSAGAVSPSPAAPATAPPTSKPAG
jgi:hypothetical protein